MLKRSLLAVTILMFAVPAFADIAKPDKTPNKAKKPASIDTHLTIRLERDAKEARLIIPRDQLKSLRAQLDALDTGGDATAAMIGTGISRTQTIVSGIFISLAIVFAGVWAARSGKLSTRSGKAAAAGIVVFAFGALATIVYGNAGPPMEARSLTGKMFAPAMHIYKFGGGPVKLEISDSEINPKLIVPDPETPTRPGE